MPPRRPPVCRLKPGAGPVGAARLTPAAVLHRQSVGECDGRLLGPYDFRPELIPDAGFMTLPGGGVGSAPPVTPPVEMGVLSAAPTVAPGLTFAAPTDVRLNSRPVRRREGPTNVEVTGLRGFSRRSG